MNRPLLLLAGVVVTFLVVALILIAAAQTVRAKRNELERRQELQESEARLQRVIDSIRLGLAIELSQNPLQVLAALTRDTRHELRHLVAK